MIKLTYRQGQESPGLSFGWVDSDGNPIDFSTYSFTLEIVDRSNVAVVTKTAGITGGVGVVDVDWATNELNIDPGDYRLLLVGRDGAGNDRAFNPANPPVIAIVGPGIGA
jgi:hypothetical protein